MNIKFVYCMAIVITAVVGAIAPLSLIAVSQSLDETATKAQRSLGRINPDLPVQ